MEEQKLVIDAEFRDLISPLSDEEFAGLERSIVAEGCRDALVLWNGILVDGYNRYKICSEHNIEYKTVSLDLESKEDALLWAINNQFGRRNISSYELGRLGLKMKSLIENKAKERQRLSSGRGKKGLSKKTDLKETINTRDDIAKKARISSGTLVKIEYLEEHADDAIKDKLRKGEIRVHKAYSQLKAAEQANAEKQDQAPSADDLLKKSMQKWHGRLVSLEKDIIKVSSSQSQQLTDGAPVNSVLSSLSSEVRKVIEDIEKYLVKPESIDENQKMPDDSQTSD